MPYVTEWKHLGTTIQQDENVDQDIKRSRGEFIGNIHALYQELGYVEPHLFLRLVSIYFCSFYGCVLWDFDCHFSHKLYATWNTMIRNAFNLPYGTHRYILKHLSNKRHLQEEFYSRFRKFCDHIKNSNKEEIIYLYNIQKYDYRSTLAKISKVLWLTKKTFLSHTSSKIKRKLILRGNCDLWNSMRLSGYFLVSFLRSDVGEGIEIIYPLLKIRKTQLS